MSVLRGAVVLLLLSINLCFWGALVLIVALPKFVLPQSSLRRRLILRLAALGERWVEGNDRIFDRFLAIEWDIEGGDDLDPAARYLVFANHISWADIFVLFRALHRRVALPRFFTKQELIWLPVVGQACSALEFPFMKRYDADYLARHPEKRGTDLETTRRACERYRGIPVTILNFLEGTRFTREKHADQESPYRFLLRPRTGGAAFVVSSFREQLQGILDVTIAYPGHVISMSDFISGRVRRVSVRIRRLGVLPAFFTETITEPGPAREQFKAWVEGVWREKDELLAKLV
jgi:1-acyl-sn-glycerol-3-phosphate acyltransferase